MSDSTFRFAANPSLEQLQKQAKELLRQHRDGDTAAVQRLGCKPATLANAQWVIAQECGFQSWAKLKHEIEAGQRPNAKQYERLAADFMTACNGDGQALLRMNNLFGSTFSEAGRPLTAKQLRTKVPELGAREITLADAQGFIATQHGFQDWAKLLESLTSGNKPIHGVSNSPPFYTINRKDNCIEPGPMLTANDWDTIFGVMQEQRITGLNAGGRMTDSALKRLAKLDHVTHLNLDGSRQLTDAGLRHLASMQGLRELNLSGQSSITDQSLAVLKHLPGLRRFEVCWQQNVTDAGMANLAFCRHLEIVNLLGTPSGDGAIEALCGKTQLRRFRTGRNVTDVGLGLLHEFPMFKSWHGGEIKYELMSPDAEPNHLLIDGPFTDAGLAKLAGLDGLFGLTFFWHCPAFKSAGLAQLGKLPNLGFLGCQNHHCDDEAMGHIAAIPKLRMLMGQGAVASDKGFAALSQSKTIEYIWGRECPNLTGRGFTAMSKMPSLRGLAVSCKNVEDKALATLRNFPALKEMMPMDVSDAGFRHLGACKKLEGLWCMYCRDTGDVATRHIAGLSKLKTYYAGKTQITDQSLEILGRMSTLENLTFWQCTGITDAGVAHLAGLPKLREISIDGSPGVTRDSVAIFPAHVHVNYSS